MNDTPRPAVALDRTVTHRLHALSKLTDPLTQQACEAEIGLPLGEGRCLAAIGSFGPLSVGELAQRAHLNKAQASRAAQSLVGQGLVRKAARADDARGVVLSLTPRGQRLHPRLMAVIERRNAEILSCLSPAEAERFSRLLDRLLEHARQAAATDPQGE